MSDKYSKFLIKEFNFWSVYIHQNQSYLGRCIVWCKRENAIDLSQATKEEQEELFIILSKLKEAVEKIFNANLINYAFLGNETKHLHGHFIPRYKSNRNFSGINFTDTLWGHNYRTDKSFIISEEILED